MQHAANQSRDYWLIICSDQRFKPFTDDTPKQKIRLISILRKKNFAFFKKKFIGHCGSNYIGIKAAFRLSTDTLLLWNSQLVMWSVNLEAVV